MTLFDDTEMTSITQGKSNEWWTPSRYIDAARKVMGGIDLDPASCKEANRTVKATKYYTERENGLAQEWYGRVWLNPPYSSSGIPGRSGNAAGPIQYFITKLIEHYQKGDVSQAVVLVTTDTDAKWFIPLWEYVICFATHKVRFHRPGQPNSGQFYGSCFVYLGSNVQAFIEHFSEFGRIAKAIDIPKPKPIMRTLWEVE